MKEALKKVYFGLIKIGLTAVSIFLVFFFNRSRTTRKFKVLKKGSRKKSASVLASGPSAREIVLQREDLLNDSDLIVMNFFANQEAFFRLKPRYYILLDPGLFDHSVTVSSERGSINDYSQERQLKENLAKVDWPMVLFMPDNRIARKSEKSYVTNRSISVVYFNATRVVGFDWFQNHMYHKAQGLPTSRNVIIPAMLLMAIIGYKTIYLYGCEFSWTKTMDVDPDNGMMFFNDRHFYSKDEIRFFGRGGYLWWLKTIVDDLEGTEQVAKYAQHYGVHIVNRTKGSFIDAFEYENPDTIPIMG